jgi:ABC-type Mn2+/Zn2+ transport system permease subunit
MTWLINPYEWWISPLADHAFMRDAVLAASLVVICSATVGTWVVLRGLSFLGDALAHGVLPGIAIAWIIGANTSLGALIAALAMVGGVNLVKSSSPLPDDASIGILFVGFLSLAVVIMSTSGGSGDLNRFLFGSITSVNQSDIVSLSIVAAVTVLTIGALHRALLLGTFDVDQATLAGFRPRLVHLALLTLIAVVVVASFETVGSLLVFAFLIAPPATASLFSRRVSSIMIFAIVIGVASSYIGLVMSYHHRSAASATMALVNIIMFFTGLVIRSAITKQRTRAALH